MKIVVNADTGSFRLSAEAVRMYHMRCDSITREGPHRETSADYGRATELRADPMLVEVVELLGSKASGPGSQLEIVEINDGVSWHILEVCGIEYVMTSDPAESAHPHIASSSTDRL